MESKNDLQMVVDMLSIEIEISVTIQDKSSFYRQ